MNNPPIMSTFDKLSSYGNGLRIFILRFFLWIYAWSQYYILKQMGSLPEPIKVETMIDILERKYNKYLDIFRNQLDEIANENIDEFMYNYNDRKEKLAEIGNEWEKSWHRRVLIEKVPDELRSLSAGKNIIMRFDAYTNAFQFYSDESVVPYDILNYIAIKYVVMYRCRDFFIDTLLHQNNSMYQEYLKQEEQSLTTKRTVAKELNNANVYVDSSKKQNSMISSSFSKIMDKKFETVKKENQEKVARLYSNSFVRLGKIADFNILQTPPKTNVNHLLFGTNIKTSIHGSFSYFDNDNEENKKSDEPESLDTGDFEIVQNSENVEVNLDKLKPVATNKMSYKEFKRLNAGKK